MLLLGYGGSGELGDALRQGLQLINLLYQVGLLVIELEQTISQTQLYNH